MSRCVDSHCGKGSSMASAVSGRKAVSRCFDLPRGKASSTSRSCEQRIMPDSTLHCGRGSSMALASAASSSKGFSLCFDLPCEEKSSTSRSCEQRFMSVSTPFLFPSCIKKTRKSVDKGNRKFTIEELLNMNTGDLSLLAKDIRSSLSLRGFGVLVVEESTSTDSKGSRKPSSIGDVYDLYRQSKKKKTSEQTDPLPDKSFAPRNSPSEISVPKASLLVSVVDSNSRATLIRSRFADTILRAQENLIRNQVDKAKKEKLEKRKANVEAELRVAETKLKEQRQKEREAARIALEKMERTVEWNHALQLTKEIQRLIGVESHVDVKPFAYDKFTW